MEIKPYEQNPKKHLDTQLLALAKIVAEVGWRQPAMVNQKGIIIVGHGRWDVHEKYGKKYKLKPIWVIDDKGNTIMGAPETKPMAEEQEKAYRIADNKLNESPWDYKLLGKELDGLTLFDAKTLGFDDFDIQNIFFDRELKKLGKDKDKFHSPNDPGWENSQNPDGIDKLVGYDLLSVWDVVEDVNTTTGKYFLPLPLNPTDKSRNRIRYSRTHPDELEKVVRTYMRPGDYFLETCVGWASFSSVAKFYGYSGIGVDIWDASLKYCKKQLAAMPGTGEVEIKEMDAMDLKFADNTFDIVYSNPPFFNLEGYKQSSNDISNTKSYNTWLDSIKKVSSEAFRVLKPNGLAIFTMADFRQGGVLVDAHADWTKLCKDVGFNLWDHAIQKIKSMSIVTRKRNYAARYCVKAAEHILVFKKVEVVGQPKN